MQMHKVVQQGRDSLTAPNGGDVNELVIVRPVHFHPGRQEEAVAWARETEEIRRRYGMRHQWVLRGVVDAMDCQMIQVWESEEAYQRWRQSDDRKRLVHERARFASNDPTKHYRAL
jgi:heme-degrading monooxygenase HmoA